MDRATAFAKVIDLIKPYVKDAAAFTAPAEGLRIIQDLRVNSARLVDIILTIEDDCGITIDDQEAASVRTIGDAVQLILAKTVTA